MKFIPARFLFVIGTFSLSLLLYIDRTAISVAKTDISKSLNLDDVQMGFVMSAFALGYALFQTPGGMLADRFGARRVLTIVVTFWSVFTAATGAAFNYVSLLIARFLFGAGEAGAFPGMARSVFSWIPVKERGLITGINFSGSRIGAAVAFPVMVWMVSTLGWRNSFYLLGAIGIVWAAGWWFWFKDDPTESPNISEKELDYILKNRQQQSADENKKQISLGKMLQSKNMWLAMFQYFCSNFTFFFCLTWLFPHLKTTYNLESGSTAVYTMLPLIGGAFGNWFSGWLGDFIYQKGHWKLSRRVPAIMGFIFAAVGLLASTQMNEVNGAVLFLTLAIFGADMTLSPSWSFCVDIGKQSSGAVSGTMNMAGNIGSFITGMAFPVLTVWSGGTEMFFYVGAVLNFVAVGLWLMMKPDQAIEAS